MNETQRNSPTGLSVLTVGTLWGDIRIAARGGCIVSCELPFQPLPACRGSAARAWKAAAPAAPFEIGRSTLAGAGGPERAVLRAADRFVRALFAGRCPVSPPVALPPAAAFTTAVWRELMRIPPGRTLTYGDVARRAGRPRAARAAGSACGANRIPLFIPCHRVLGGHGAPGGFSAGLGWKRLLLEREGAIP